MQFNLEDNKSSALGIVGQAIFAIYLAVWTISEFPGPLPGAQLTMLRKLHKFMLLPLWQYSRSTLFVLTLACQLVKPQNLCNKIILQRSAIPLTLVLFHNFQNIHHLKEH